MSEKDVAYQSRAQYPEINHESAKIALRTKLNTLADLLASTEVAPVGQQAALTAPLAGWLHIVWLGTFDEQVSATRGLRAIRAMLRRNRA